MDQSQPATYPPPQQPPPPPDASSPTANFTPDPNFIPSHPSYTEMISAAILWDYSQGKVNGSSKRAIANYIDRVHTNLPPAHPALLIHHLQRLKNSGQLVMIKNSYQLPSLSPSPQQSVPRQEHVSPQQPDGLTSSKRKPGRPPKLKRPNSEIKSESKHVVGNGSVLGKRPRGRPPKMGVERIVHRDSDAGLGSNDEAGLSTVKRRGRPPRIHAEQVVREVVQAQEVVNMAMMKRRPGRPAKKHLLGSVVGPVGMKKVGRPRGRPLGMKSVSMVVGKRRGRKPKWSMLPKVVVANVDKRMYTGKPRGRPKKNFPLVKHTSEQEHEKANKELLTTLEDMQSKIKDAVGIIRSHVTDQSPPDALTALQQLEHLSTMKVTISPTLTASPLLAPETLAPETLATPNPTDPTTVPYSFSTDVASVTASVPLHAEPSIEIQPPLNWAPPNEA